MSMSHAITGNGAAEIKIFNCFSTILHSDHPLMTHCCGVWNDSEKLSDIVSCVYLWVWWFCIIWTRYVLDACELL